MSQNHRIRPQTFTPLRKAAMRISLVPLNGGHSIVMSIPIALVGRGEECDFRLEAEGVADMHCVLALSSDMFVIRALDTDSIRVNGQRIQRAVLVNNNHLDIASVRFQVRYEDDSDDPDARFDWNRE
jgi:hypothetical protein